MAKTIFTNIKKNPKQCFLARKPTTLKSHCLKIGFHNREYLKSDHMLLFVLVTILPRKDEKHPPLPTLTERMAAPHSTSTSPLDCIEHSAK